MTQAPVMTQAPEQAPVDNSFLIKQLEAQIQGLSHQLEASKLMFNEQLETSYRLRTQGVQQNQNMQLLAKKLADSEFQNKKLNDDNAAHLAKITELDAKLNPALVAQDQWGPAVIPDNGQ